MAKTINILIQNQSLTLLISKEAQIKLFLNFLVMGVDAKWANILYIGQIPDKDIQAIEKSNVAYKKVRTAINKEDKMFFKNEIFSIRKIR